jgi:hypothetical protein
VFGAIVVTLLAKLLSGVVDIPLVWRFIVRIINAVMEQIGVLKS